MSALALLDASHGHEVFGSDRAFAPGASHPALAALKASGISIVEQDGSGIHKGLDLAVFSTAVEDDTAEAIRARELGVMTQSRPERLAEMVSVMQTVAVTGTSGKSTTAGMLALAMHRLGMEPTLISGGMVKDLASPTNPGNFLPGGSGRLVVEACESDGSIAGLHPEHTIVLNLALDHMGLQQTASMFRTLADNTSEGKVLINADDHNLVAAGLKADLAFSVNKPSEFRAESLSLGPLSSEFSISGQKFRLRVPGLYNVYNAVASAAMLSVLDVPLAEAARALESFSGIRRRFDVHLNDSGKVVVDDYAHNPHKIAAMMASAARLAPGVCYVFQPHGYEPTRLMMDGYIKAFSDGLRDGDRLIVLPIYYAGGTAQKDVSSEDIARGVREHGGKAEAAPDRDEALRTLSDCRAVVVMGARDETLSGFAAKVASAMAAA